MKLDYVQAKAKAAAIRRGLDDAAAQQVAERVVDQLTRTGSWIDALTHAVININKEK
jgi:hypothetical protein